MDNLIIDPELQDLIPPPGEEELNRLEESLIRDGCMDTLKAWQDNNRHILLDGHNRFNLCRKLDIPYRVEVVESVSSRYEAIQWMIDLQLARRNLTSERQSYLRGRRYNEEKREVGAPTGNDNAAYEKQLCHDDIFVFTANRLADAYGVSPRTITRDALYASAIDALDPQQRREILAGKSCRTKAEIVRNYQEKTGRAQPHPEKQFEKLYRTDTRKAIDMLAYHLQVGNREIQIEILTEIMTFLNRAQLPSINVDLLWSRIRHKDI